MTDKKNNLNDEVAEVLSKTKEFEKKAEINTDEPSSANNDNQL